MVAPLLTLLSEDEGSRFASILCLGQRSVDEAIIAHVTIRSYDPYHLSSTSLPIGAICDVFRQALTLQATAVFVETCYGVLESWGCTRAD